MRVYLNDWSLADGNGVFANWEHIKAFDKLIDVLSKKCALELYAPKDLWQLPLAGCDLVTATTSCLSDKGLNADMANYLRSIYGKMHLQTTGYPIFSETDDMANPSSSVGRAAAERVPVLSFAFGGRYAKDIIEGWEQNKESEKPTTDSVMNIYEEKPGIYAFLADLSAGRHKNPLATPLWNTELSAELLNGVDFINVDTKKRQGMLIEYGRKVAEMNGWRYDSRVSKLNQNSGQLRYIFSSENFVDYAPAYLSLDMEGPDLAFELCDKRGNHQGEYSWNGSHKDPKDHHGIKVR